MGTCALGQSVWKNSPLFFYKGILGCSFFACGYHPTVGGASAAYVLQARVLFACITFLGTLRNFFVYVCARTCIIYACNCLP